MTTKVNQRGKIIHIRDGREAYTEDLNAAPPPQLQEQIDIAFGEMRQALRGNAAYDDSRNLMEAFIGQPDAALMFADGVRYLSFDSYRGIQQTYPQFCQVLGSERPDEQYLMDSTLGTIPESPSGTPAPSLQSGFAYGVNIVNKRYAGQVSVTGDDLRYAHIPKIAKQATELGRAARSTEERAVYAMITASANYTRNSTTGDNDVGANTAATTFSPSGLELALTTISTAKDRNSGEYLGLSADTLIVPPRLEFFARQLLSSGTLARVGGNTTNDVYGGGTVNPFAGMLSKIIVSPWFGTLGTNYGWALLDSRANPMIFQRVEAFNVLELGANSERRIVSDEMLFVVAGIFGVGIVDDRAMFLSTSTTAPNAS